MDLVTIYVSLTLLSFTALLVSINISPVLNAVPGARFWYATLIFLALGSILIAARGRIPGVLSIELANTLLIFSPACMIISMSKLRSPQSSARVPLILATTGSVCYALAAELSGMRARLVVVSASTAAILGYGSWLLCRVRGVIGVNWMMISWLLIMAVFAIARVAVTATADHVGEDYVRSSRFQAFYMLAVLASTFGFSAAFIVEVFHRMNGELDLERSRLARSSRSKELMLRVISHDLRGPLGVMTQLLSALRERLTAGGETLDQWTRDVVDGLQRQASVTYRLLEDLLTWSQRETSNKQPPQTWPQIREIAADALVFHAPESRRKKVALEISEGMVDAPIPIDRDGLSMVLRNLISNALKYSLPGGTIRIDALEDGPELILTVTDDGIGVNTGIVGQVKAGKHVASAPGTLGEVGAGMGLTLCRDWLEAAGGRLTIRQNETAQQGTRVEVALPLRRTS